MKRLLMIMTTCLVVALSACNDYKEVKQDAEYYYNKKEAYDKLYGLFSEEMSSLLEEENRYINFLNDDERDAYFERQNELMNR